MLKLSYILSGKLVNCIINDSFINIHNYSNEKRVIIITDENIFEKHQAKFSSFKTIKIPAGESYKIQATVDAIILQLLEWHVNKNDLIVGVGGGVVTDMAGFVASIYKRGVEVAMVPTTILGMVDASLGGKNGINNGAHKNMVGTIYQPSFILYDFDFLESLPQEQWINGFAEIIKHACIKDERLFELLESNTIDNFKSNAILLQSLIERNVKIKMDVVTNDEFENGERRLLNFGHTLGHAIENTYELPHGHAISIGMVFAAFVSADNYKLSPSDFQRLKNLLHKYQLPISLPNKKNDFLHLILDDKKRLGSIINFIILDKIGNASTEEIEINEFVTMVKKSLQ
jgi:3-dehydroquinate synthase